MKRIRILAFVLLTYLFCTAQVPLPFPNVQAITAAIGSGGGSLSTLTISNRTPTLYSFTITCPPSASTLSGNVTFSGITGSLAYTLTETTSGAVLQDQFAPILGSGPGTAITMTVAAIGGATCNAVLTYSFLPSS